MTAEFDKAEEIPPLNLYWEDNTNEEAGGELFVLQKAKEDVQARTIIENAALSVLSVSDMLFSVMEDAEGTDQKLSHVLVHGFCWSAVRDLRASMFLAMTGRYRQAKILHRSALETVGLGVYFEESDDPEGWEAWYEGANSDDRPDIGDAKNALASLDPSPPEEAVEALGKRWGIFSRTTHTFREGDIDKVMFGEEITAPIAPWAAYFDLDQLKDWYEDFLEEMHLIGYLVLYYWEVDEETEDSVTVVVELHEDVTSGRIRHWAEDIEFDL